MNLQLLDHNPRKKMILQIELLLLTIKKNKTFILSRICKSDIYIIISNEHILPPVK